MSSSGLTWLVNDMLCFSPINSCSLFKQVLGLGLEKAASRVANFVSDLAANVLLRRICHLRDWELTCIWLNGESAKEMIWRTMCYMCLLFWFWRVDRYAHKPLAFEAICYLWPLSKKGTRCIWQRKRQEKMLEQFLNTSNRWGSSGFAVGALGFVCGKLAGVLQPARTNKHHFQAHSCSEPAIWKAEEKKMSRKMWS